MRTALPHVLQFAQSVNARAACRRLASPVGSCGELQCLPAAAETWQCTQSPNECRHCRQAGATGRLRGRYGVTRLFFPWGLRARGQRSGSGRCSAAWRATETERVLAHRRDRDVVRACACRARGRQRYACSAIMRSGGAGDGAAGGVASAAACAGGGSLAVAAAGWRGRGADAVDRLQSAGAVVAAARFDAATAGRDVFRLGDDPGAVRDRAAAAGDHRAAADSAPGQPAGPGYGQHRHRHLSGHRLCGDQPAAAGRCGAVPRQAQWPQLLRACAGRGGGAAGRRRAGPSVRGKRCACRVRSGVGPQKTPAPACGAGVAKRGEAVGRYATTSSLYASTGMHAHITCLSP